MPTASPLPANAYVLKRIDWATVEYTIGFANDRDFVEIASGYRITTWGARRAAKRAILRSRPRLIERGSFELDEEGKDKWATSFSRSSGC